MFQTTHHTLKLLAALVWFIGVIVLTEKSSHLFIEADAINPDAFSTWLAILAGLVVGAIKAKYLFSRLCIKNLKRIDTLEHPKLWHFYRVQFFIFLFAMVSLGGYLSRQAHGDYTMLLTVAAVELSIAIALLLSSHIFWKQNS